MKSLHNNPFPSDEILLAHVYLVLIKLHLNEIIKEDMERHKNLEILTELQN